MTTIAMETTEPDAASKPCIPAFSSESSESLKPSKLVKDTPSIPSIHCQDVVRSNVNGLIGVVMEVAGDSDSDSSSEDYENENADDGKDDTLADQIQVIWIDDSETSEKFNNVTVVDRGFLHGDFVAAASDPTGQVGVVVDVNISVDLVASDGSLAKGVSSRYLERVSNITVGDFVVLGSWVGRVDEVMDNVTVLFDDGSMCTVINADPARLKPIRRNIFEDGHISFYPGQRVKATSSEVFKRACWLSGSWKRNRVKGIVAKVTVGRVFIYWIASAGYGPESSTTPNEEQNPKYLKLLSCFSHTNWHLGDWCLLPSLSSTRLDRSVSKIKLNDSMIAKFDSARPRSHFDSEATLMKPIKHGESMDPDTGLAEVNEKNVSCHDNSSASSLSILKEPVHKNWPVHCRKLCKVAVRKDKKSRKIEKIFERALLIFNTETRVDITWQDGVTEHDVKSTDLIPIDTQGDHDFIPEQYVVEKSSLDNDDDSESRRVGVVQSVNAKDRTACVSWLKPVIDAEDPREFDKEEVVSVYQLEWHPDYDYCYGDVVIRLSPPPVSTETLMEFTDLSWVGNITGLKNGDIEVTWADGMISRVGPQSIYVVGRDDDESSEAGSNFSAVSWETVNADKIDPPVNSIEPGIQVPNNVISEESTDVKVDVSERNGLLSYAITGLEFFTNLATGFLGGQKHINTGGECEGRGSHKSKSAVSIPSGDEHSSQNPKFSDNVASEADHILGEFEQVVDGLMSDMADEVCSPKANADAALRYGDDTYNFKHFDTATNPLDHHFLSSSHQISNERKWLKRIQQDWSILQNNLPDGIYVRVYEDRIDVLRAAIVGACGTPYHDGLFFFDFHLPSQYPYVAPSVYYHSGGWRINPNLYEEGNVCLSLLNTWSGRKNETWDASSSSILQVLVSLQGLVLNCRPYFNEAGYERRVGTREGEKNSLSYNENILLLNLRTMMLVMRRPPKDFGMLIEEHFKRRGYYILKACDAYMKGCLIGSLTRDADASDSSKADSTSVGFKLILGKIVPRIYLALSQIGAECDDFKHLL